MPKEKSFDELEEEYLSVVNVNEALATLLHVYCLSNSVKTSQTKRGMVVPRSIILECWKKTIIYIVLYLTVEWVCLMTFLFTLFLLGVKNYFVHYLTMERVCRMNVFFHTLSLWRIRWNYYVFMRI